MAARTYLNFDLLIDPLQTGYRVRVLNSPVGQALEQVSLAFSATELIELQTGSTLSPRNVRSLGKRLFESIFQGEIENCLARSLDRARDENAGLRIRLRLNDVPELAGLPWEYLYHQSKQRFLALSEETPVVRYLDLPEADPALAITLPLRILVMIADPSDISPRLDSMAEWQRLLDALKVLSDAGLVILERLPSNTLEALQIRLQQSQYHIFHFIGHGFFDTLSNQSNLLVEDHNGKAQNVSADALVTILRDHRALRLVFLNACEGGRNSQKDIFTGMAQSLVQQGVPAVIAMQFAVTDNAAANLAPSFYRALANGYPVDAALTEARKALYVQNDTLEWATPVLFTRAPDGQLFTITGGRAELVQSVDLSPFKGLHYFDVADAELFYGRETLIAELVAQLTAIPGELSADHSRFLAVIGASGSGKSSLVRAGLIPAIQRHKELPDSAPPLTRVPSWWVKVITPTANPLESLATSLTQHSDSTRATANLLDELATDPRTLHLYIRKLLAGQTLGRTQPTALPGGEMVMAKPDRVLLVVDQFEELFTLCRNREMRKAFIDNLLTAAGVMPVAGYSGQGVDGPTSVVITLRADFYAHCADFEALRAALERYQKFIGLMNQTELRRAIEEPARHNGWEFEQGLVDLILDDVGSEPGALPLLSHALLETWRRRDGRILTYEGYTAAGRVQGAIAQTAEKVFNQLLTPDQRLIARNIFLRLTELGEGVQDTRRRAALSELIPQSDKGQVVETVLRALADARLVITDKGVAEVAHEALIREWPQLREWLADDREGLRVHRRLTEAAMEWQSLQRDPGALLRGIRLAQTLVWTQEHDSDLNDLEQEFLHTSQQQVEQERQEQETARRRELEHIQALAKEQQQRAEEQTRAALNLRRRNVWLRLAVGATALLALLAIWFGVQASRSAEKADASALEAQQEKATAVAALTEAEKERQAADLARNLALSNLNFATQQEKQAKEQAKLAEERRREANTARLVAQRAATSAAASQLAAKAQLALADSTDVARSYPLLLARAAALTTWITDSEVITQSFLTAEADLALRRAIAQAPPWQMTLPKYHHIETIWSVVFSPDGKLLLTGGNDHSARVWDVATHQQRLLLDHTSIIRVVAFSHDAKRIATSGEDGVTRLWDAQHGDLLQVLHGHVGTIFALSFSQDDHTLLTAGIDKTARLWEVATGQEIGQFQGHIGKLRAAAFSPDESQIVTASEDKTAIVWDVATFQPIYHLEGHTGEVRATNFSPNGRFVVTAGDDSAVILWDAKTGKELRHFAEGHQKRVWTAVFSPDSQYVLTSGDDSTARLWEVATGQQTQLFAGHNEGKIVTSVTFSPDGTMIVTTGGDSTVRFWDWKSDKQLNQLENPAAAPRTVTISPNGQSIVTAGDDKALHVWDAKTGNETHFLLGYTIGYTQVISTVLFSPDGTILASAGAEPTIRLWSPTTWQETGSLTGHADAIKAIAISPDSQRLASAGADGTTRIWDLARRVEVQRLQGYTATVQAVAFSADGQTLVTAAEQSLRLWDVASGREVRRFPPAIALLLTVAFSPDGETVATGDRDGVVQLWRVTQGQPLRTLTGHEAAVTAVRFSPDGKQLVTASADNTARLWNLQTDTAQIFYGHVGPVTAATFSADGQRIVTTSLDRTARIWLVNPNRSIKRLSSGGPKVNRAVFSPDGSLIAAANDNGTVQLWTVASGTSLALLTGHSDAVNDIAFNDQGDKIATVSKDQTVRLWETADQALLEAWQAPSELSSVAFSPNDQWLALGAVDKNIYLWKLATTEIITLTGHTNQVRVVSFSPDGTLLASAGFDQTIRLWDVAKRQVLRTITGHTDWIHYVTFSPDGHTLISTSSDRAVRLWDVATGQEKGRFTANEQINTAVLSPDAQILVAACEDSSVWFWDMRTGVNFRRLEYHTDAAKSAFFSPDGNTLLTASEDGTIQLGPVYVPDLLAMAESLIQADPPIITSQ